MTDEGMRLLREAREDLSEAWQMADILPDRSADLMNRIDAYLSRPEPQGETPLTDAADDPTMRFSARHERLKDLCKFLERRLREAEAHVKELRGRFQLCNEERERQHTRAEAAERGKEGMVPAGCEILCATCRLPPVTENIKRCDSGGACPLKYMLSAPSPLRSGTSADIRASVKEMNDQVRKDAAMLSAAEEKK